MAAKQQEAPGAREAAERERAPEPLLAGQELYRFLADTTPLPVIVVDLDGIVLHANARATALFEVPWAQVVGQCMPDFYIDPQARVAFLEQLRQDGRVAEHEMLLETATGRKFWALVSAGLVPLQGRPTIFTTFNDITERRRMEDELRQRAEQLERARQEAEEARRSAEAASSAQSIFLANMSHELRTPLNAILGFSDLLAQSPTLTAAQRDNAATIHHSGELLLQMINDVLAMAKIEAGRINVEAQDMDLRHLLDGLVELFRLRATDKGLAFEANLAPDLPRYIVSDERKVRHILVNLLSNAIKFTEQGGVSLRVQLDQEDPAAGPPGPVLICAVRDTGPGIAPEHHDDVFHPFVQPNRRGHSQEGTGLGLPISRRYAQLLGGSLTLSSTGVPGAGALLELRIPVTLSAEQVNAAGDARHRKAQLAPGQPAYRLLVVDDQPDNRLLLEIVLQGLGFAVRTAQDGLEALRLWEEWQPHLIWLDLHMPGLDGYEVARRIKAAPEGRATTIVALTGSTQEQDRERGLAAGCDDFLHKPFQLQDLPQVLVRHLGVRFLYTDAPGHGEQRPPGSPPLQAPLPLAGLPSGWLAAVRQAAIAADGDRIVALVEEVAAERPALAAGLRTLVEAFDYQTILQATAEETHAR